MYRLSATDTKGQCFRKCIACNKLISTTAHESVNIISTKWFMHISHLISVNIFLENFDTFLLFDLLV